MKLSSVQVNKIDPALREVLERAEGHEPLRTVMVLGTQTRKQELLRPSDFADRTAYREASIKTQQQQIADDLNGVKKQFSDRSLSIKGGNTSRAVVVEGTADNILSSLDLPDVQHASLDQKITL